MFLVFKLIKSVQGNFPINLKPNLHTANDPLSAGSSKHDFDTAVRVYMMIEAYHEVIMSQLLIIRV